MPLRRKRHADLGGPEADTEVSVDSDEVTDDDSAGSAETQSVDGQLTGVEALLAANVPDREDLDAHLNGSASRSDAAPATADVDAAPALPVQTHPARRPRAAATARRGTTPTDPVRIRPAQPRRSVSSPRDRREEETKIDSALESLTHANLEPLRTLLLELSARLTEVEAAISSVTVRTSGISPALHRPTSDEAAQRYSRDADYRPLSTELGQLLRETLRPSR